MAETITMPKLGFDMREGILVRWVKNEGEVINKGDVIAEIETDKATVEVESSASGVVRKLMASQGDSIPVGSPIAIVGTADEIVEESPATVSVQKPEVFGKEQNQNTLSETPSETIDISDASGIKASPLARKIALDSRVNLSSVIGTGPGGRIVRRDVDAVLASSKAAPNIGNSLQEPIISQVVKHSTHIADRTEKTIQTSKLRQAIGRRLVESKQNLPHFYVSHEYKMDALLELRKKVNALLPDGEKTSVNDFIVKATALALSEFPNLNASLEGTNIIQHGSINVGVAVTVPGGLLTIVVKETDQKSLLQISSEVKNMAARARDGKIKPEDVDGSTFSTSNLGMYDVENFIAIINPPEAAILAIGSSRTIPVVENDQIKIGNRMKCTLSVDHRISDGSEAAQFMQALGRYIEEPLRLIL